MEEEDDGTKLLENALGAVRRLHAFVVGPNLRTLKMRFNMCIKALESAERHRAELITENKKLKVMNQELGKKAKTLDTMRDLLVPVHGA